LCYLTERQQQREKFKICEKNKKVKNEFLASHLGVGSHLAGFEMEKESERVRDCVFVCVCERERKKWECVCVFDGVRVLEKRR